ncbi:MAG: peroxide stress protein YaaA [Gammaproteobacteria bacterium]|nr:peroxide stress protein YaaA [Gammaproteobacteria bacterium]MYD80271.1 peroxide stress protein YaaA [Gammaproteobacteria bacterium]
MLVLLSPSKNLDFKTKIATRKRSEPMFLNQAQELIYELRQLDASKVSKLMGISGELGELNAERYANWQPNTKNGRQAALAFRGDVYLGLGAKDFSERDLTSAQRRVRILSGLYGVLRPLDLIHPYRLEMGTGLRINGGRDLYGYWSSTVTDQLNSELDSERNPLLVNCASSEYFPETIQKRINYPVVNCRFLQKHGDDYRFMSYFGKRARGLMARHLVLNRASTRKEIKAFNSEGYYFSPERSTKGNLVFLRDVRPNPAST